MPSAKVHQTRDGDLPEFQSSAPETSVEKEKPRQAVPPKKDQSGTARMVVTMMVITLLWYCLMIGVCVGVEASECAKAAELLVVQRPRTLRLAA